MTAVHVSGMKREPPFAYSYSVKENTVPRAPPITKGISAPCSISFEASGSERRDKKTYKEKEHHPSVPMSCPAAEEEHEDQIKPHDGDTYNPGYEGFLQIE